MDHNLYVEDTLQSKLCLPWQVKQFLVLPCLTAEQQIGTQAFTCVRRLALGALSDSNTLRLCAMHLSQKIFSCQKKGKFLFGILQKKMWSALI